MGDDRSTELENMKNNMETMQEMMRKMMEMILNLQKGKGVAEDSSSPEQSQNHEGIGHDLQELKVQVAGLTRLMEVLIAVEKVHCCKSNSSKNQTCFKQPNGPDTHDSERNEKMMDELKVELAQLKPLMYEVAPPGQSQSHPPSTGLFPNAYSSPTMIQLSVGSIDPNLRSPISSLPIRPPIPGLIIPDTSTLISTPVLDPDVPKEQEMAPDRVALQNMEKKAAEGFKDYARRWNDVASQVQPPLTDKEKSSMFLDTLKGPYFDKMIGNACQNFTDLVMSGELIELAVKSGKIKDDHKKGKTSRKKDGEAQAYSPYYLPTVSPSPLPKFQIKSLPLPKSQTKQTPILPPVPIPAKAKLFQDFENGDPGVGILGQPSGKFDYVVKYSPPPSFYEIPPEPSGWGIDEDHLGPFYPPKQSQVPASEHLLNTTTNVQQSMAPSNKPKHSHTTAQNNRKALREEPHFDSIPISYTELLPKLIQAHLVAPVYLEPLKPPYPKWYNANIYCGYHMNIRGHSTENCTALKHKVKTLIKIGALRFAEKTEFISTPRTTETGQKPISITDLLPLLIENRYITPVAMRSIPGPSSMNYVPNGKCDYHIGATGHSTEKCEQLKEKIESLINDGTLTHEIMERWKSTLS